MGSHACTGPREDSGVIAGRIEEARGRLEELATEDRWNELVAWHGGIQIPVSSLVGIALNECAIHGHDIAAAEKRPWSIDPDEARLIIDAHFPFLPSFVDRANAANFEATYELSIRGGSTVYIHVHDGTMTIDMTPTRPDCRISVDPVDYLLVGYGRKGRWGPILKGKIVAWGRRPWLGTKFATLFETV